MRFFTTHHQFYCQFYCGIDLHASSMFLCIMDHSGEVLLHRNYRAEADALLRAITPYREDLVVAVECIFTWYWIADLCSREGMTFVLGYPLYMKAIRCRKTKKDKIDSQKIAALLRSGMLPMAYVYPQGMRSTRDLLCRRLNLARRHAELQTHIQNTNTRYNLPYFEKRIDRRSNRTGIGMRFTNPVVRTSVEVDVALMDAIHQQILTIERQINAQVPEHDPVAVHLLRRYGKAKALSIIAQKLGRTVYTMLKRRTPYDARRFFETLK